jgi:hypothetical protein
MIEYDDGVENDYSISGYRHQNRPTTYTEYDFYRFQSEVRNKGAYPLLYLVYILKSWLYF